MSKFPLIPLRDIVVFPHMVVTLFVGREKSMNAVQAALEHNDGALCLFTQKSPDTEDPTIDDLSAVGVEAMISQIVKLPDGAVKLLVKGVQRVCIDAVHEVDDFLQADVRAFPDTSINDDIAHSITQPLKKAFQTYSELNKRISQELVDRVLNNDNMHQVVDIIVAQLTMSVVRKQEILSMESAVERLEEILSQIMIEIDGLRLEERVKSRVKTQMDKSHREYYLSEQMKAIQNELKGSSKDGEDDEADLIEQRIKTLKLSNEAKKKATSELKKLRQMSTMSSEASVTRNYLDWLLNVPWSNPSTVKCDLVGAKTVLDQDHYGLTKVKDRILEHLAVQKRLGKTCGQILCFVGPPGVGKTSLGKSIAAATGREFVRISLGGMKDESEIRGHRRTYIGAMPGRIVQAMKKAGTTNPVILLDEIDKLGSDWRGDPSSAFLEVLDPAQNKAFSDHYLEVDYDLSDVLFITTANSLNMQRPLRDRMEIISIAGYTEDEKVQIATRHLLEKQRAANGLKDGEFVVTRNAMKDIIRHYTSESGVRNLERVIASLARKSLKKMIETKRSAMRITCRHLKPMLGVHKYRFGVIEQTPMIGVTTGLAWTEVGGDLLTIEASVSPGKGKVVLTGKLGEVMQESSQAALSYIRSRSAQFGIPAAVFMNKDIHVHVPEGATPKDGPSAGTAILTSLVSVLTGNPVRSDVAMTGEITLRGRVLPIGGLKEKLLAAQRGGAKMVLLPEENKKDLEEIQASIKKGLEIIMVENAQSVLSHALMSPLVPLEEDKSLDFMPSSNGDAPPVCTHITYPTGSSERSIVITPVN